jgi:hypothetical protein
VSVQCHTPAVLYSQYPLSRRPQSWSGHRGQRKESFASAGDQTLVIQSAVRHYTTELPTQWPKIIYHWLCSSIVKQNANNAYQYNLKVLAGKWDHEQLQKAQYQDTCGSRTLERSETSQIPKPECLQTLLGWFQKKSVNSTQKTLKICNILLKKTLLIKCLYEESANKISCIYIARNYKELYKINNNLIGICKGVILSTVSWWFHM